MLRGCGSSNRDHFYHRACSYVIENICLHKLIGTYGTPIVEVMSSDQYFEGGELIIESLPLHFSCFFVNVELCVKPPYFDEHLFRSILKDSEHLTEGLDLSVRCCC